MAREVSIEGLGNSLGGNPVKINPKPLQRPGHHRIEQEVVIGGPEDVGDRRMYLHVEELRQLLEQAEKSRSRRVVLHHAGVKVTTFRTSKGHVYQAWQIVGGKLESEEPEIFTALEGGL